MTLVSRALHISCLYDMRTLRLVRLLKLHQLARVVLLRNRVTSWPRMTLDAAGLHRASTIDLAADLCVSPEICDAVAS